MKKINAPVLLAGLLLYGTLSFAGGPLQTDENCKPFVFPASSMPVPYTVDRGPLGLLASAEATAVVDDCFGVWQAVPTASISFTNAGFISQDITESNVDAYLDSIAGTGVNPVVFDSDGGIIDYYYGAGASENIIGFSYSNYAYDAAKGYYLTDGLSLLNGRFTREPYNWDAALYKATFVHEFGHFIGLDHCQINGQYVHDDNTANDIYIPTMYPTSTDDDTPLGQLNPDDAAALTLLYPASDAVVNGAYGRISGTLRWLIGLPARGVNIVAIKQGDELMSRFSSVSDYCMQGDGSFEMLVTPGAYTFIVEPIDTSFYGGSSVGPYAETPLALSFIFPAVPAEYPDPVIVEAGKTATVELKVLRNWLRPVPGLTNWLLELLLALLLPSAG